MAEDKAKEIWMEAWKPETHTTEYALKRIKSAKSAKLTPIKIDTIDLYGYFQGSHGKYETFLDHCPCGDFRRGKLPCKHIYRLAIELGLMDIAVDHDVTAIPVPKEERANLDETIDIVEELSADAQHELLKIASGIRSTTPVSTVYWSIYISELMDSGIIIDAKPGKYEINFGGRKKKEIAELLESENISYDKKAKKGELEKLCTECILDKACKKFGKIVYVSIPTKFSPTKIHYYLHRKYDSVLYFDSEEYELPLLETELPDDDITKQLIKRGYYIRR